MTAIRIVCTHDAVKLAETLARLLGAEGHDVRMSYGRQSLDALTAGGEAREAVLLIWSYDAPSTHYMLEWAIAIAPERLAEIARASGWPRTQRLAPVIDFTAWRGERGGRAWNMLAARLRAIDRIVDPKPEPLRAPAIGVGVAGAVAAAAALFISADRPAELKDIAFESDKVTLALIDGDALGGPMNALEPASISGHSHPPAPSLSASIEPLPEIAGDALAPLPQYTPLPIHEPTMLERVSALIPGRRDES